MGVSNLWNGLWNGLMEWTDGMEYQLTKIAKTHYRGRGEVVSTVLPLLAQLDCYVQPLFSSLVPRPMAECSACGRSRLCLAWITYPWFWQRGCQVTCALIGTSLSLLRLIMDQHLDEASYM